MTISELDNKIIWINGASRGIGAAIAERLSKENVKLILSSGNSESIKQTAKKYSDNSNILVFPCDISKENEVFKTYEKIVNAVGEPDILINNAGIGRFASLSDTSVEEFDAMVSVNFRGTFLTVKSVLPSMLKKESGIIINILSIAAFSSFTGNSIYAATKAAVRAMDKSLRNEVRNKNIKVVDIFPGATETDMWDEESRSTYHSRMMQPEDIAEVVYHTIIESLNNRLMIEEIVIRPQGGDL